jgi:hypothetical protein
MPLNSAASASVTPDRCIASRSQQNPRIGASPVPAETKIIGLVTSCCRRNPSALSRKTFSRSPGRSACR